MNFNKTTLAAVAALTLSFASTQANAYSWSYDTGFTTSYAASTVTFEDASAGGPLSYTSGVATFASGAIYSADQTGESLKPYGSTGQFWSIGATPSAQNGPGVVTLAGDGVKYYGFLWGSSDAYNGVTFSLSNGQDVTISGSQVPAGQGWNTVSRFFNFFADENETIMRVSFASDQNAFETDNHAYSVTAVPEVETYAMMLAGLGLMGTIARRRNKAKAA
jgi:hypothetical protein